MPDRYLDDTIAGQPPEQETVQQLIEAEHGRGTQGINRAWQASDSNRVVLTSDAGGVKISRDNGTTPPAQVIVDGTAAGGQLSGTYPNPTLNAGYMQALLDAICPPGGILAYGGPVAPAGFLLCNGQAVSRSTYPRLFAAIATNWGAGDGSTTFNVPNLTGRFPLGSSGSYPFTQPGGSATAPAPAHTHPEGHDHSMQGHVHGMLGHTHDLQSHVHPPGTHTHQVDVDHDHPNALAAAGPTASALNGRFTAGGATALPDNHDHPVNLPALGATLKTSLGPSAANTSTPSPNTTGGNSTNTDGPGPGRTDVANLGAAANFPTPTIATLPPYLAVQYIIRTGN